MTSMHDTVDEIEDILQQVIDSLDKLSIKCAEVDTVQAGDGMSIVTFIETSPESITEFINDDAHVFWQWDHLQLEDGKQFPGKLHIYALQNGLMYAWILMTKNWAAIMDQMRNQREEDRLDPLRHVDGSIRELANMIENSPEEFVQAYVEAATKGFDDNDLSGNYHQIRHLADRAMNVHSIPYRSNARDVFMEMQPELKRAVEENLLEKRDKAIDILIEEFPDWYREQGSPRLSKNLVKLFAQGQGYRFTNQFVDELKVRIDVAIAKAN